jgi:dihydropyrimidinase
LVLETARQHGLTLNRCVEALAARAARWFGLYPRKGTLLPGSDADLAVWDLSARTKIRSEGLSMGSDWTPYEGFTALAEPELVLVRGTPVVADGRECAPPGHGNFLQRLPSALAGAQPAEAVASASRS